ncbi:hypothetical protein HPC62_08995 [Thermoleptolyngbya sichuanensis A183]|uniref:Uncharacterized protein n=1 Tax=Thermoleptolyngbya sichuanensis A183 TaxID=2737172 RepID=A0A6M8BIM5_9CYAN|nr:MULTISPECIES: hypothetical protein [Thermoleptolyngbya]QKD82305.1 hypothetical protein HPC62_08995 [Thermoleptolyngbya sichuanensis A183]
MRPLISNDPISKATMRATGIVLVFVGGLLLLQAWNEVQTLGRRSRTFWQDVVLGSAFAALGVWLIVWGVLR